MRFYATAETLRRSRLKQSNPSTLTVAVLCPNFARAHETALPRVVEDGDDVGTGGLNKLSSSFPNCESWTRGFEDLLGGDPKKKGGDEATSDSDLSTP